jgi:hypothetical protein
MSFRGLSAALCLVLFAPLTSARAERLTDEQVKKLIEDIDRGFDTWRNATSTTPRSRPPSARSTSRASSRTSRRRSTT